MNDEDDEEKLRVLVLKAWSQNALLAGRVEQLRQQLDGLQGDASPSPRQYARGELASTLPAWGVIMAHLERQPTHTGLGLPVLCPIELIDMANEADLPIWVTRGRPVTSTCGPAALRELLRGSPADPHGPMTACGVSSTAIRRGVDLDPSRHPPFDLIRYIVRTRTAINLNFKGALKTWARGILSPVALRNIYFSKSTSTAYHHDLMIPVICRCSVQPLEGAVDPNVCTMGVGDDLYFAIVHTNAGHDVRRPQHHPVLSALSADDVNSLLHTPVVVVTCDGKGNLLKQNMAAAQALGFQAQLNRSLEVALGHLDDAAMTEALEGLPPAMLEPPSDPMGAADRGASLRQRHDAQAKASGEERAAVGQTQGPPGGGEAQPHGSRQHMYKYLLELLGSEEALSTALAAVETTGHWKATLRLPPRMLAAMGLSRDTHVFHEVSLCEHQDGVTREKRFVVGQVDVTSTVLAEQAASRLESAQASLLRNMLPKEVTDALLARDPLKRSNTDDSILEDESDDDEDQFDEEEEEQARRARALRMSSQQHRSLDGLSHMLDSGDLHPTAPPGSAHNSNSRLPVLGTAATAALPTGKPRREPSMLGPFARAKHPSNAGHGPLIVATAAEPSLPASSAAATPRKNDAEAPPSSASLKAQFSWQPVDALLEHALVGGWADATASPERASCGDERRIRAWQACSSPMRGGASPGLISKRASVCAPSARHRGLSPCLVRQAARVALQLTGQDLCRLSHFHRSASLLFTDIPDFDELVHSMPVQEVMLFLNHVFSVMDAVLERHDVYKVETVGCSCVVASGLFGRTAPPASLSPAGGPHSTPPVATAADLLLRSNQQQTAEAELSTGLGGDDAWHAPKLLAVARELVAAVREITAPDGRPVRLRVGLNAGPLVTGVVGTAAPRFCCFGDTVNTAARMMTSCEPGRIHATAAFQELVPDATWEHTGGVHIKGKGSMETYTLRALPLGP